jgi:hypothetical protein
VEDASRMGARAAMHLIGGRAGCYQRASIAAEVSQEPAGSTL